MVITNQLNQLVSSPTGSGNKEIKILKTAVKPWKQVSKQFDNDGSALSNDTEGLRSDFASLKKIDENLDAASK